MDNNKLASIPRSPQAKTELRIESVHYPHIAAGEYHAYVTAARVYYDGGFKRNVCCILFDILDDSMDKAVAEAVPMWLNLGNRKGRVKVGRRSRYRQLWEQAHGGPALRGQHMGHSIFVKKYVRVLVEDSAGEEPHYSVVRAVLTWCGGQTSALGGVEGSIQHNSISPRAGGGPKPSPAKPSALVDDRAYEERIAYLKSQAEPAQQIVNKPQLSRDERDRRAALTKARKRGLAPSDMYPRESWEQEVL